MEEVKKPVKKKDVSKMDNKPERELEKTQDESIKGKSTVVKL